MIVWANRLSLPLVESAGPGRATVFERTGLALRRRRSLGLPPPADACSASSVRPRAFPARSASAPARPRPSSGPGGRRSPRRSPPASAGAKLALLDPGRDLGPRGERIASFEDHIRFYADHDRAGAAGFLDASGERDAGGVGPAARGRRAGRAGRSLCERVAAAGSSAYAVDVTSPDVAELGPHGDEGRRSRALRARRPARRALPRRPPPLRGRCASSGCGAGPLREDERQPRPASVPMTRRPSDSAVRVARLRRERRAARRSRRGASTRRRGSTRTSRPGGSTTLLELARGPELSGPSRARAGRTTTGPAVELPPPAPAERVARRCSSRGGARPRAEALGRSALGRALDGARRVLRRGSRAAGGRCRREARSIRSSCTSSQLAVDGLERGVYHYDPFRHRLARLAAFSWPDVRAALVDPAVARQCRRSGRRDRDLLALAVQVRPARLPLRAARGRSRRPERRARRDRARRAGASARRLLRPAARRARRCRRPRRGDGLRARARWCDADGAPRRGRRLAAGAVLAARPLRHGARPHGRAARPVGRSAHWPVGALAGRRALPRRRAPPALRSRPARPCRSRSRAARCSGSLRPRGDRLAAGRARRAASLRARARRWP